MFQVSVYYPTTELSYFSTQVDAETPYQAAEMVAKTWQTLPKLESEIINSDISTIMPIHNFSGMRDPQQIYTMATEINKSQNVVHENGLPNPKMVVMPDSKLLLFDGHHTLLAYYQSGKRHLNEVPHLIISSMHFDPLEAADLTNFFPETARDLVMKNWEDYVVNWQAGSDRQIEKREIWSMSELADAFTDRYKASSQ